LKLLLHPEAIRWSSRYIAEAYLNVYQIANALGRKSIAREHLRHAHEWNLLLQGELSIETRRTGELIKQFK
jgi:hypothetical protein